jgi:hypothetical protein
MRDEALHLVVEFDGWKTHGPGARLLVGTACSSCGVVHLVGEGGRRPRALLVTPGQWGDAPQLIPVMERIRVGRPGGGHPRTRPDHLGGDKTYSSRRNRRYLRQHQIKHTIPEPKNQRANRQACGSKGGRPVGFDKRIYKRRNEVERTINALKSFRLWPRGSTNAPTSSTAPSSSPRSDSGSARDPRLARGRHPLVPAFAGGETSVQPAWSGWIDVDQFQEFGLDACADHDDGWSGGGAGSDP